MRVTTGLQLLNSSKEAGSNLSAQSRKRAVKQRRNEDKHDSKTENINCR